MSGSKLSPKECVISLKILAHRGDQSYGISLAFQAEYLTILALVASVISFLSLGAFVGVLAYIFGQYLRLTN